MSNFNHRALSGTPFLSLRGIAFAAAFLVFCAIWIVGAPARSAMAQSTVPLPAWLEPRGVNIADLVGVLPEEHLRGSIISYATGSGTLQYEWGVRNGDEVFIRARVYPYYGSSDGNVYSAMGCLGQPAFFDQMPSTAPASTMRLFTGTQDITDQVEYAMLRYTYAGLVQPMKGVGNYDRYARSDGEFVQTPIEIPANNGCFIAIDGIHDNLYAEFTMTAPQKITATHIKTMECEAHSYVGYLDEETQMPAERTGILTSLAQQMSLRFEPRHNRCPLETPSGVDFLLVNYPLTPFDPYIVAAPLNEGSPNFNQPGSGTYRLEARGGGLSVDHVAAFGMPLNAQWQDPGQLEDYPEYDKFLHHKNDIVHLTVPEYFIPPGFSWNGSHFDACMVNGGCPDDLLEALYNSSYTFNVYYYQFERLPDANLIRIPLRQVGPEWTPADSALPEIRAAASANPNEATQMLGSTFLPLVGNQAQFGPIEPESPVEDVTDCPCGWFDEYGRMYDYTAKPVSS